MQFNNNSPIYLQIAELLMDEIAKGTYPPEERVPSVRDYGIQLEVNVNTVVKAFDVLLQQGLIYNRRGMGNYVSADAPQRILSERRQKFFEHVKQSMEQLGITPEELLNKIK